MDRWNACPVRQDGAAPIARPVVQRRTMWHVQRLQSRVHVLALPSSACASGAGPDCACSFASMVVPCMPACVCACMCMCVCRRVRACSRARARVHLPARMLRLGRYGRWGGSGTKPARTDMDLAFMPERGHDVCKGRGSSNIYAAVAARSDHIQRAPGRHQRGGVVGCRFTT